MDLRAIDAKIAEHVFGWKRNPNPDGFGGAWITEDGYEAVFAGNYSTDIALAIGVLEKVTKNQLWGIKRIGKNFSICIDETTVGYKWAVYGCPLPEAICRHVLHVLGVQLDARGK